MDTHLRQWIEEETGRRITSAEHRLAGGSREFWAVELGDQRVALRVEAGGLSGTELSLAREAQVYRSLSGSGVPVPTVLGDRGDAILLEWIDGESRPFLLDGASGAAVEDEFFAALGALHRLDPAQLDLFPMPGDARGHALDELRLWSALADSQLEAGDRLLAYSCAWLEEHAPEHVQRSVLVHGDAGPGNFIYEDGSVKALLDWEFAHIGDPMDDVAWCDFRSERAPAFADWRIRDRLYEQASGLTVEPTSVAYYAVFVQLRCVITTAITIARGGGALGLVGYLEANAAFRLRLARALAEASGEPVERITLADSPPTPTTELADHAASELRACTFETPTAKLAARNAERALRHLERLHRYGGDLAEAAAGDRRGTELARLQREAARQALLWGIDDVPASPDRQAS